MARPIDPAGTVPPTTAVWIDAAEAVIVRLQDDQARLERVESDVPAHHKATGHVRHDSAVRHGGGGSPQTAGEPHRLEHLKKFIADVASRLAPDDHLLILGPGTVHEHLMRNLSEIDRQHGRDRAISCQTSPPMTDPQLIARLRRFAGVEPRRSLGRRRWSRAGWHPSGRVDRVRVAGRGPRPAHKESSS